MKVADALWASYLLVELQVKDKGLAKGFHREAALSQMDGLRKRGRRGEDKTRPRASFHVSKLNFIQAACAESQLRLTGSVSIT